MQTKIYSIVLTTALLLATGTTFGQIDFDSLNVIQTSFTRQMAEQMPQDNAGGPNNHVSIGVGCNSDCGGANQGTIYRGIGVGYASDGCNSCGAAEYGCNECGTGCDSGYGTGFGYDGNCGFDDDGGGFGLQISGIVDVPLDGIFQTGYDARW